MSEDNPQYQAPAPFSLGNVTRGRELKPFRLVTYGVEGSGKTTFAANAPDAIFIASEDGTSQLDVARFPAPRTYSDLTAILNSLYNEEHDYKTVVVDSVDWCQSLLESAVVHEQNVDSIEGIPYGKGYVMVAEKFRLFLTGLSALRDQKGMNVILIAHCVKRKFQDPRGEDIDRYELACSKHISPIITQWCDALLFTEFDERFEEVGQGFSERKVLKSYGDRVLRTEKRGPHDGKNRYNLPYTLPMPKDAPFEPFLSCYRNFYGVTND